MSSLFSLGLFLRKIIATQLLGPRADRHIEVFLHLDEYLPVFPLSVSSPRKKLKLRLLNYLLKSIKIKLSFSPMREMKHESHVLFGAVMCKIFWLSRTLFWPQAKLLY